MPSEKTAHWPADTCHGTHAHMQHTHNNKKVNLIIKIRPMAMAAFSSSILD